MYSYLLRNFTDVINNTVTQCCLMM